MTRIPLLAALFLLLCGQVLLLAADEPTTAGSAAQSPGTATAPGTSATNPDSREPSAVGKAPTTPQEVREMAAAGRSFRGASLAGMDLAGLRAANMDLSGTNWTKADLRGASFTRVVLAGASMDEINGRGISFIDCDMAGLSLRRADLAGAVLRGVDLSGADLTGSGLWGAELDRGSYSRTGGRHTGTVAAALALLSASGTELTGPAVSTTLAAGLCGDPFAFVYNTADAKQWPMAPFTESPIRAAMVASGHEVEAVYDLTGARATEALVRAVQAGKVCLLPIALTGEEMRGPDLEQAFWAVTVALDDQTRPTRITVAVPPFGKREYRLEDLARRWEGPWPTLEPAGPERTEARYPLLVVTRGKETPPPRDVIAAAVRHAATIILERRTYASLVPGVAGFKRLSEDLARAGRATDFQLVGSLSEWGDVPRQRLISARLEAADFLEQAESLVLQADSSPILRAAALLRGEAQILTDQFPSLKVEPKETLEQVRGRFLEASQIVSQVAGIEAAVAAALLEVSGPGRKPAEP